MAEERYFRIAGQLTSQSATSENILQFPAQGGATGKSIWLLVSFHFVDVSGGGSTWAPRLGQSAGWTDADIDERYNKASGSASIREVFVQPIPCQTDANSRLHFRPEYDGSADNVCNYEFWFKKARGS